MRAYAVAHFHFEYFKGKLEELSWNGGDSLPHYKTSLWLSTEHELSVEWL